MRAVNTFKQSLISLLQPIHLIRLNAVFWAVSALLHGGRLSLTCLGRAGAGKGTPKHAIKRSDRLLGNKHLQEELPLFYRAIAHLLLKKCFRPLILIDWTRIEPTHVALVASVPLQGRSLPIYLEVHSEKYDSNRKVMRRFLIRLQSVLPLGCKPIVVTDAGFRNHWFKAVQECGWDYVGRLRNTPDVCPVDGNEWSKLKTLYHFARATPKDIGLWIIARSNPLTSRVIAYRKRKFAKKAEPAIGSAKLKRKRKMKEPWLLATSLKTHSARQVVNIYRKRMQIEETFRDAKNHRFGWSFRHARTDNAKRYEVMLLIATIAMFVSLLVGCAGEKINLHRRYQANTIRSRRVLSLLYLGCSLLRDGFILTVKQRIRGIEHFQQLAEAIDD